MLKKSQKKYFDCAAKINRQIFKFKAQRRKLWAKEPMEKKIEELVKLQEIMVGVNSEMKNLGIIPWKVKKT